MICKVTDLERLLKHAMEKKWKERDLGVHQDMDETTKLG